MTLTVPVMGETEAAPVDSSPALDRPWWGRVYLPALAVAAGTAWLLWVGLRALARGSLWANLDAGWMELVAPLVVGLVALLLACERRWPAERRPALARGHLHDAAFFVVHVVAFVPVMILLGAAFGSLLGGHGRWMEAPGTASWPRWLLLGVTLVLMDGANWLAHLADHRFAPLWRMHALHHSQEELSVLTSFRAHPLSHLAGFFLATVPVIVLMGDQGMAPFLITGYVCLGTLPHANVRWSLGPLGKVVVSPAYHRLHHSVDGTNGYNLGVVLTVWDVLAGRAVFPAKGDPVVATGLAHRPVPAEQATDRWRPSLVLTQLAEPFTTGRAGRDADRSTVGAGGGGTVGPLRRRYRPAGH